MSRLLRFHGTTPLARRLRKSSGRIRQLIAEAGGTDVRVFGSAAAGTDGPDSDVHLLFSMKRPLSLLQLGRLVLAPDSALLPDLRERVLAEAIPL